MSIPEELAAALQEILDIHTPRGTRDNQICSVCIDTMNHPRPCEWQFEPYPCPTIQALVAVGNTDEQ